MYNAYVSEEVLSTKTAFESCSFDASKDNMDLFIGNRQGHILYGYPSIGKAKYDYQLFKDLERRPIACVKVLFPHKLLLCLMDSIINVLMSSRPFTLIYSTNKYRPISEISHHVSEVDNTLYVLVAERKRLILLKWIKQDQILEELADFSSLCVLSDNIQKIGWCSSYSIVFSVRDEYFFLRIFDNDESIITDSNSKYNSANFGNVIPLFNMGARSEPLIVEITAKQKVGLARDSTVVFVDALTADYSTEYNICRFSDAPFRICYDCPYLCALLPPNIIEIRSIEPYILIQKIILGKSITMIASGIPGIVFAGSEHRMMKLDSRPLVAKNIEILKGEKQYGLALALSDVTPNLLSPKQKDNLQLKMANSYFGQKRFSDCFNIHYQLKTDVLLLVNFFPKLIPEKYLVYLSKIAPVDLESFEAPADANFSENEFKAGILALSEHLALRRIEHEKLVRLHYLDRKEGREENILETSILKKHEEKLALIDTVLMKCYLIVNPSLVTSLLKLRYCGVLVSEAESDLYAYRRTDELVTFYWKRRIYRKALELLKRDASMNSTKIERFAKYLQILPADQQDLLYEYSLIVLQEDVSIGVQIFTRETNDDEDFEEITEYENFYGINPAKMDLGTIDNDHVLAFLKEKCTAAVIPFLEFIVFRSSDDNARKNPRFHQILLEEYIRNVHGLMEEYIKVIADRDDLGPFPYISNDDELISYRKKLQIFLETSTLYEPSAAFNLLTDEDNLIEERAILYGRLGQHEEALFIYSHILLDYEAAEKHCQCYFSPDNSATKDIYFTLYESYAKPSDFIYKLQKLEPDRKIPLPNFLKHFLTKPREPNILNSLKLLRKHADEIDTVAAIAFIPMDTPFYKVWISLQSVFESLKNKANAKTLMSSVVKLAVSKTERRLKQLKNRRVFIEHVAECWMCRKRIGESTFVLLCDNSLAHFFCYKQHLSSTSKNDYIAVQKQANSI